MVLTVLVVVTVVIVAYVNEKWCYEWRKPTNFMSSTQYITIGFDCMYVHMYVCLKHGTYMKLYFIPIGNRKTM